MRMKKTRGEEEEAKEENSKGEARREGGDTTKDKNSKLRTLWKKDK